MPNIQTQGVLVAPQNLFQARPTGSSPSSPNRLNSVSRILNQAPASGDRLVLTQPSSQRGIPAQGMTLRPLSWGSSSQTQQVLQWANHLLQTVKNNKYVLGGTQVDFERGIVNTDCSGLMRALFKKVGVPLTNMNAAAMTNHIKNPNSNFQEIFNPAQIQAGDLIGVKMPKADVSGHVMLAWGPPQPIVKDGKTVGYNLRILDSSSAHSEDSRKPGQSGIGTGIISVKIHPQSGRIDRIYWKANLQGGSYPGHDVAVGRHR